MEFYRIIHDPEEFKGFSNQFLASKKNHALIFYLVVKNLPNKYKKYKIVKHIFINGEHNASSLYREILKLECPAGAYQIKDYIVPTKDLYLYCSVRIKDVLKCMASVLTTCMSSSRDIDPYKRFQLDITQYDVKTNIKYVQLNVYSKDEKLFQTILTTSNIIPLIIIETETEYNIIYISSDTIDYKKLNQLRSDTCICEYNKKKQYMFSIANDPFLPVPGTYQGDYKVTMKL